MENQNEQNQVIDVELKICDSTSGNDFAGYSIHENLRSRSESIQELREIIEDGTGNFSDLLLEPLFKTQNLDAAIISDLLDVVGNEAELREAAAYWKKEAEKWQGAFTAFRYQNRI